MKIHEYQAKALFREAGIPVPEGKVATSPEEARSIAEAFGTVVAVKAQVHTGGRGKAGGVKIAKTPDEAARHAGNILGMEIKGSTVRKVLVERGSDIAREAYLAITMDRSSKAILLIASAAGGIDIEEVAAKTPEKILKLTTTTGTFSEAELAPVAQALFDDPGAAAQIVEITGKLLGLYLKADASLAEINPLVLTGSGNVVALDGKVTVDDNALFRQPALEALRDFDEEVPQEIEAREKGLSFVQLDGDIGCMVNGA
ncbi:MAG: acetate--CoA ligase family protein, partial [Kiritimatiellae bacterium]|nr:acetate--CoA ligase family protein [Kiritimatiellia bacterium]